VIEPPTPRTASPAGATTRFLAASRVAGCASPSPRR